MLLDLSTFHGSSWVKNKSEKISILQTESAECTEHEVSLPTTKLSVEENQSQHSKTPVISHYTITH